jgi:4-hydroxybenzoate polyprenyltransferase
MADLSTNHTDIPSGDWIDRRLPSWAVPYARLMRLDRPIGVWLLLLPCWWGVILASGNMFDIWLLLPFAVGAVLMRGAGCVVNDIYDRNLDRLVERTRDRPLASGELHVWQAVLFLAVLLFLSLGILLLFNRFTAGLGVASLTFVFLYPLAKRVTWWPQLVLGLAFNWGALMGWSAVRDSLGLTALLLYAGGVFWTLAYDTIYAHQDLHDDALVGIRSLALKLGQRAKAAVALFYVAALVLMALAGYLNDLGRFFYALVFVAALHAFWLVLAWNPDDPADCLKRFRANRDFGLIVLVAIAVGKMV